MVSTDFPQLVHPKVEKTVEGSIATNDYDVYKYNFYVCSISAKPNFAALTEIEDRKYTVCIEQHVM